MQDDKFAAQEKLKGQFGKLFDKDSDLFNTVYGELTDKGKKQYDFSTEEGYQEFSIAMSRKKKGIEKKEDQQKIIAGLEKSLGVPVQSDSAGNHLIQDEKGEWTISAEEEIGRRKQKDGGLSQKEIDLSEQFKTEGMDYDPGLGYVTNKLTMSEHIKEKGKIKDYEDSAQKGGFHNIYEKDRAENPDVDIDVAYGRAKARFTDINAKAKKIQKQIDQLEPVSDVGIIETTDKKLAAGKEYYKPGWGKKHKGKYIAKVGNDYYAFESEENIPTIIKNYENLQKFKAEIEGDGVKAEITPEQEEIESTEEKWYLKK